MAQVNCPNCGASLTVDPEDIKPVMFCMHCGTRITDFDDLVKSKLEHERKIELETLQHVQEMERIKAQTKLETTMERRIAIQRGAKAASSTATGCLGSCLGFIGQSIVIFGFMFYMAYAPKNKLENQVKRVQQLIAEGNYDLALIEAQSIRKDKDGLFDSEPAFWEQQRKDLIKLIEQKKKESE